MRIPAFLAALALLSVPVAAQCSTFANSPPGSDLQLDDDALRTVGLGFSFPYNGQSYTAITVCSNGFCWLGAVSPGDFGGDAADFFDNETDFLAYGPRIAVCWDDWNPEAAGAVYFATDAATGTASVVWQNVPRFTGAGLLNAELVLTASGEFFCSYDSSMVAPSDNNIAGSTAGGGSLPNRLDWTTALPVLVPACTGYQLFLFSTFDLATLTIRHVPTAPSAINHQAQTGSLSTCPPGSYPPLAATPVSFGTGCPVPSLANPSAIYETFTPTGGPNATDLSGLSVKFVRAGTIYVTAPGPGFDTSYLTQGTVVPQFDESIAAGLSVGPMGEFPFCNAGFATVDVAANGYVLLQGGSSDFSPTAIELLAGGARIAPHWTDYDLTFAGTFYWSNNDPGFCMATWVDAEMFAQPGTANTFQVKLMANGDIIFSYGAVASAFDDVLVGITLGNGAPDPGASDLSAAIGSAVVRDLGTLTLPLTHSTSGPASIGTNFQLRARNLNGGVIGAFVIGATPLAVDLTAFGMPGCWTWCSIDEVYLAIASGGLLSQSFFIPALPSLYGVTIHTQAAMFTPINAFGLISSNRMTFSLGL